MKNPAHFLMLLRFVAGAATTECLDGGAVLPEGFSEEGRLCANARITKRGIESDLLQGAGSYLLQRDVRGTVKATGTYQVDAEGEATLRQNSRRLRQQLHRQMSTKDTYDKKYTPGSDGTYAQNYQDKWIAAVAHRNGWDKPGGFFLDLGAFDGLKCSNTALVEKRFGWKGICVEPRPVAGAFSERNCLLVERALADETGKEVMFYGTPGSQNNHIDNPLLNRADNNGAVIKTLNMPDLVDCVNSTDARPAAAHEKCNGVPGNMQVPNFINFISLDVEGNGLNVLRTFPFDKVSVGAWVVEKEASAQNDQAADAILTQHGYIRVPVENPGVDKYFIQPQFWEPNLVRKAWRYHPWGSDGC